MNIEVRSVGKYAGVTVYVGNATLELGLLTPVKRAELAEHLREAAQELWPLANDPEVQP